MRAIIQGDGQGWLTARLRHDPPALLHRLADTLLSEAPCFLPGSLQRHPALLDRARAVLHQAHREDDGQPLLSLWSTPPDTVAAAIFPLSWPQDGESVGAIRRLHVGHRPPQRPAPRRGWSDLACRVVERRFQLAPLADQLWWWLEPEVPGGPTLDDIDGESMGFAAVAALTSLVSGVPVPARLAFTGVLRQDGTGLHTAPVAPDTLADKIAITNRIDGVDTLVVPDANRSVTGEGLGLRPTRQPDEIAALITPRTDALTLHPPTAPHAAPTTTDAQRRTLALLIHADRALRLDQIERALHAWRPPLPTTPVVPELLDGLPSVIREVDGTWQIDADAEPGLRASPRWRAAALAALSRGADRTDPEQALVYAMHAGDHDRARRLLLALRAAPQDLAAELRPLERVRTRATPGTVYRFLDQLPGDLPSRTLRLAWRGLDVPWPLADIARRLIASEHDNDRLFTVQAMAEAALHLLASVALAEGVVPEGTRLKLDERPSVGLLYTAAATLVAPRQTLGPIGQRVRDAVGPYFSREERAGHSLQTRLNQALHLPGSVTRLRPDQSPPLLDDIVPSVLQLYALTCEAFRDCQIRDTSRDDDAPEQIIEDQQGHTLPLGRQLRRARSGALWWRGHVQEAPRWWAYDSVTVYPSATHSALPLAPLDISTLPTPLAHAVLSPRRYRDPIQRLAALRLGLASLLRLAWFPTLCELDPNLRRPVETGRRPWLMRMNHRNLVTELTLRGTPDDRPTGWLPMPRLWRLLDMIERLEHAPGPSASWDALLDTAGSQLTDLVASGPWIHGWRLVARRGDQAVPLHGANPLRPHGPAPRGLADGELGWIGPDDACLRLGPFATWTPSGVRWVAQVHTRKKVLRPRDPVDVFTSGMGAPGMQIQTTHLQAAPDWPGGVRLSHEP